MKAWEFLETHEWCQGASARNEFGNPVYYRSNSAKSFCASGCVMAVYNNEKDPYLSPQLQSLHREAQKLGQASLAHLNDYVWKSKAEAVAFLKLHDI